MAPVNSAWIQPPGRNDCDAPWDRASRMPRQNIIAPSVAMNEGMRALSVITPLIAPIPAPTARAAAMAAGAGIPQLLTSSAIT